MTDFQNVNLLIGAVETAQPSPVSKGTASGSGSEVSEDYISYVHHMTANKKLIKAKDLFYQLGFQKGVSKSEIENAAIGQYKLAASKQVLITNKKISRCNRKNNSLHMRNQRCGY